jgi:hypothetical protein
VIEDMPTPETATEAAQKAVEDYQRVSAECHSAQLRLKELRERQETGNQELAEVEIGRKDLLVRFSTGDSSAAPALDSIDGRRLELQRTSEGLKVLIDGAQGEVTQLENHRAEASAIAEAAQYRAEMAALVHAAKQEKTNVLQGQEQTSASFGRFGVLCQQLSARGGREGDRIVNELTDELLPHGALWRMQNSGWSFPGYGWGSNWALIIKPLLPPNKEQ